METTPLRNFYVQLVGHGRPSLERALRLALGLHSAGTVRATCDHSTLGLILLAELPASPIVDTPDLLAPVSSLPGVPTIRARTGSVAHTARPLPHPLHRAESLAHLVEEWLVQVDHGPPPLAPPYVRGWHLYTDTHGAVGSATHAVCAIRPAWAILDTTPEDLSPDA